jgi:rod shape-determining protein MreD
MAVEERAQPILLPAKPGFIAATLALALLFNLLPWRASGLVPDAAALVLAFWCVHQPRRMGIGIAWLIGLLMDAGDGTLLGQHALGYAVLAFAAIAWHRRILWFPPWQQAAHVWLILFASQLLMLAAGMAAGGAFPGLAYFGASVVAAAASFLLLLPQRRPEETDPNRGI